MKASSPIPVRLPQYLIDQLDIIVKDNPGSTRAGMIRFLLETWLNHIKKHGLPADWEEINARLDGRTAVSKFYPTAEAAIEKINSSHACEGIHLAAEASELSNMLPSDKTSEPFQPVLRQTKTKKRPTKDNPAV